MSEAIAMWLELEGTVSHEDHSLFAYAAFSFLFGLLPIGIVLLLGLCFGMVSEGLVLIIPFMLLRKFCGGFHLKSPKACFAITVSILALTLGLVKQIIRTGTTTSLSVLVCVSAISLFIFSPVENPARVLSDRERGVFRIISRMLTFISLAIYVHLSRHASIRFASAFGAGIVLVGLLQIPCVHKKHLHSRCKTETTQ